jgi:hypothetical protein
MTPPKAKNWGGGCGRRLRVQSMLCTDNPWSVTAKDEWAQEQPDTGTVWNSCCIKHTRKLPADTNECCLGDRRLALGR